MRKTVHRQLPLVPALREHFHVAELEEMSRILDGNPEIAEVVHFDLVLGVQADKGAKAGLSADQVVRAASLYHHIILLGLLFSRVHPTHIFCSISRAIKSA